jgi:ABC-type sugar transport system substrate-binding protein
MDIADYIKTKNIANPVVVEMKGLLGTKPQDERHDGARKSIDPIPGVKVIEVQDMGLEEVFKDYVTGQRATP